MKKIVWAVLMTVPPIVMAGDYPPPGIYLHEYELEETYDKFRDSTTLNMDLKVILDLPKDELELVKFYAGEGREKPRGRAMLHFTNTGRSGWRYLKDHSVVILADNDRMSFKTEHKGDIGDGYVFESFWADLSDSQFEKLWSARTVEIKVGSDEITLSKSCMEAIRDFASYFGDGNRVVSASSTKKLYKVAQKAIKDGDDDEARRVITILRAIHAITYEADATDKLLNIINEPSRIAEYKKRKAAEADERLKARTEELRAEEERAKAAETVAKERTANRNREKASSKLKLAKALEASNPKAALDYYREVVKNFPDTDQAKKATERIKVLEKAAKKR